MERIAEISKYPKQNLIYYFPNKKTYCIKRVVEEILDNLD